MDKVSASDSAPKKKKKKKKPRGGGFLPYRMDPSRARPRPPVAEKRLASLHYAGHTAAKGKRLAPKGFVDVVCPWGDFVLDILYASFLVSQNPHRNLTPQDWA